MSVLIQAIIEYPDNNSGYGKCITDCPYEFLSYVMSQRCTCCIYHQSHKGNLVRCTYEIKNEKE